MKLILQLLALASGIAQFATEPSYGSDFISLVLVLFPMAVAWQLLTQRQASITRIRRHPHRSARIRRVGASHSSHGPRR